MLTPREKAYEALNALRSASDKNPWPIITGSEIMRLGKNKIVETVFNPVPSEPEYLK